MKSRYNYYAAAYVQDTHVQKYGCKEFFVQCVVFLVKLFVQMEFQIWTGIQILNLRLRLFPRI